MESCWQDGKCILESVFTAHLERMFCSMGHFSGNTQIIWNLPGYGKQFSTRFGSPTDTLKEAAERLYFEHGEICPKAYFSA